MVETTQTKTETERWATQCLTKSLSVMQRKLHVAFLGEWRLVTAAAYPTNNSLNDLSSGSNTDQSLHVSIEILPCPISNQKIVEDLNTCEQHFDFLAKEFENKIIVWIEKNAMHDFFSYLDCKVVLKRFTGEFEILFNNLICTWVARNGILTKEAEGFDLFKALKKLYISLNKKYSLKLKDALQVAKLEYNYAMDDEAPEPDSY